LDFLNNFPIAIEIYTINASTTAASDTTIEKRGMIRSSSELEQISQLISNPKVVELTKNIE
jgi:hypothetical protein